MAREARRFGRGLTLPCLGSFVGLDAQPPPIVEFAERMGWSWTAGRSPKPEELTIAELEAIAVAAGAPPADALAAVLEARDVQHRRDALG